MISPLGPKASPEKFVGIASVNELVPKSDTTAYAIGDVVFEPGARNNWHTHQARQIMLVTDGKGWYQEHGKSAIPLKKGNVYIIPAWVEHWHGQQRKAVLSILSYQTIKVTIVSFGENKLPMKNTTVYNQKMQLV